MNFKPVTSALALFILLVTCTITINGQENYKKKNAVIEYTNQNKHDVIKTDLSSIRFKKKVKNVILLIGDGMGVAQLQAGMVANNGQLNILNMREIGFSQTQSASNYITDSAAGGTAISTGERTKNGMLALSQNGDTLVTIVEQAKSKNMLTGLISSSAITHATPASFIAHQQSRKNYEAIALDYANTPPNLFMGGGKDHFANRKDKRNLCSELQQKGFYIADSLAEINSSVKLPLAVLSAPTHLAPKSERGNFLSDATTLAVQKLTNKKQGFFLMIEGSQIDWGGHKNNVQYIVDEVLDFDQAVGVALQFAAQNKETLVIVTADHETGGMSINKCDPNTGKVDVSFSAGKHTGIMVPVFAFGPGAENFKGIYKNTEINSKLKTILNL